MTVTENKNDPLFQPLRIKHLTLKNRIMSTSHASGMDDGGMPGERYQRYHEEKAKGGLALTMFGGSSNVAPDSPSVFDQLRVDNDRVIPFFQSFSERIHAQDAALMCQITHLGCRGDAMVDYWLPQGTRIERTEADIEKMKREIRFKFRQAELERLYLQWIRGLRSQAFIEIKDSEYVRRRPDA